MRQVTFAAAALAAAGFAMLSTAYADSNYGPNRNGDQCWHRQLGDSLGYWSKRAESRTAQAERTNSKSNANSKSAAKKR